MITVILKGALGNQMFQYALGKSLSLKYNVELYLDLSFLKTRIPIAKNLLFKNFTYRDYALDLFKITDATGSLFKNDFLDKYCAYPVLVIKNRVFNSHYINEGNRAYDYDPSILECGPDATLEGYWNNYNYFSSYAAEITSVFDIDKLYSPAYDSFEDELKNQKESVAIHIRRGDYLNAKNRTIYVALTGKYYNDAINYIKARVSNPHFYVFAQNEDAWIAENISLTKNDYTIVDSALSGNKNTSHFRFMALCKHTILSNSTFSWWTGYLNKNPQKIVVTPAKWLYKYHFANIPGWVTIESE